MRLLVERFEFSLQGVANQVYFVLGFGGAETDLLVHELLVLLF